MPLYTKACILGLGASGESAARLLLAEGVCPTVVDADDNDGLRETAGVLRAAGAEVHLGCRQPPEGAWEVCVVSPGAPPTSPLIRWFADRNVPLISELELGWSRARGPALAITGSNGKSTVVAWCADALRGGGVAARIAGNYGPPLCAEVVRFPEAGCWVLEVSSFQLETIRDFRVEAAVLLNVLPNHLDRHVTMDEYLRLKCRIFENARPEDTCVVPAGLLERIRRACPGDRAWTTFGVEEKADYRYQDHGIYRRGERIADISGTLYDNPVMGVSAAAVYAALMEGWRMAAETVTGALRELRPLPHRMQTIGTDARGVRYVDDSKATNLAAMQAAVAMQDGPVRLIAGGLPKEKDFDSAKEVLAQRVRSVYLIGQAAEAMFAAWHEVVPCVQIKTLKEAVKAASNDASLGETVVLSPGCASFDQFRDYVERGEQFTNMARELMAPTT